MTLSSLQVVIFFSRDQSFKSNIFLVATENFWWCCGREIVINVTNCWKTTAIIVLVVTMSVRWCSVAHKRENILFQTLKLPWCIKYTVLLQYLVHYIEFIRSLSHLFLLSSRQTSKNKNLLKYLTCIGQNPEYSDMRIDSLISPCAAHWSNKITR